jgi:hypothetical protein
MKKLMLLLFLVQGCEIDMSEVAEACGTDLQCGSSELCISKKCALVCDFSYECPSGKACYLTTRKYKNNEYISTCNDKNSNLKEVE